MSGTALIIVDYQYDFLPGRVRGHDYTRAMGGPLAIPDGDLAQPVISRIARQPTVDLIVMSRDWHPEHHCSFSTWPVHCVQGTHGAEFDETLFSDMKALDKPLIIVTKADEPDKEALSAFLGHTPVEEEDVSGYDLAWIDDDWPPLVSHPRSLAPVLDIQYGITDVIVVGLSLDYCVKATALDAIDHGFKTTVVLDGTRPVGYLSGARAVRDLVKAGVKVV